MPGMRWLSDEFDYRYGNRPNREGEFSIAERLGNPAREVGIGDPNSTTREMSNLDRQIYQDSGWHFVGKTLLRKLSEEEVIEAAEITHDPETTDSSFAEFEDWVWKYSHVWKDPANFSWFTENRNELLEMFQRTADDAAELADTRVTEVAVVDNRFQSVNETLEDILDNGVEDEFAPGEGTARAASTFKRDSYQVKERYKVNPFKEASERRINHFTRTLDEIDKLYTNDRVVSVDSKTPFEEWEKLMDRLRDSYQQDKQLRDEWNEESKMEWRTLAEQMIRASLTSEAIKHNTFIDEEFVRIQLWLGFDRKQIDRWNIFLLSKDKTKSKFYKMLNYLPDKKLREKHNCIAVRGERTKPSMWDTSKSWAFIKLNLTSNQWRRVYEKAWAKFKFLVIWQADNANTPEKRQQVRKVLGKYGNRLGKNLVSQIASILAKKEENNDL
jgi:hypothetical protein